MTMTKPVGALTGFARRLRYGNGRRSQAAHRASVCDIGDDVDSFVGVGVQPDPFVVGRVIGLLDCEVSPKYGRSVGLCGYSGLSVDLACDGAVLRICMVWLLNGCRVQLGCLQLFDRVVVSAVELRA